MLVHSHSTEDSTAASNSKSSNYNYSYMQIMAHNNHSFEETEPDGRNSSPLNRPHILVVNKNDGEFLNQRRIPSGTWNQSSESTPVSHTPDPDHTSRTELASPTSSSVSNKSNASNKKPEKPRSGPSSRRTVLIIASFFVVGTIFLVSGVIVLCTEQHPTFQVAGGIFVAVGLISFVLCLFLQQKNVKKLMHDLEQDLYFLNIHDNKLLRSVFSFDGNTYSSNQNA